MPARLFIAPSQQIAWPHAAARIASAPDTLLLVPNVHVERYAREQLPSHLPGHLQNFYSLSELITGRIRERDALLRPLLRHCLAEMAREGELTTFAPIGQTQGLVQILIEWLREIKQAGVPPREVRQHATTRRDLQLARLYELYQGWLRANDRFDGEGLLWAATEVVERGEHTAPRGAVWVIGFDQFSPLQLRLLRALSEHQPVTLTLLDTVPRRGSSRLHRVREAVDDALAPVAVDTIADDAPEGALAHVRRTLFVPGAPPAEQAEGVTFTSAPSREAEVRGALGRVKKLLQSDISPRRIAIVAPQLGPYTCMLHDVALEYDVPLHLPRALALNPAVETLVTLLGLAPRFPWQESVEALDSPYVAQPWLDEMQRRQLERLTRERPVLEGREQWRAALEPFAPRNWEEELGPRPLAAELTTNELQGMREGLEALFDHLSPPPPGPAESYVTWIEGALLGPAAVAEEHQPSLGLRQMAAEGPFAERDGAALDLVIALAERVAHSFRLLGETAPPWADVRAELVAQLNAAPFALPDDEGVSVITLGEARAAPVDHLFILGMAEGEFPRPPAVDPLYTPQERTATPLPLATTDDEEDAGFWWQEISRASRSLHLYRPHLDDGYDLWPPSPFWEAVRAALPEPACQEERLKLGALPTLDKATSAAERLLARTAAPEQGYDPSLGPAWQGATRGFELMVHCAGDAPAGPFEGIFVDAALKSELATRFPPERRWSLSRLNRYHSCAYGFFVRHVLELESQADPGEGMTAAQRGSLLHSILESYYRQLAERALSPARDQHETLQSLLAEECERAFAGAPRAFGFRRSELWEQEQQEMLRMLRALVQWECEDEKATFRPFYQELQFGLPGDKWEPLRINHQDVRLELSGVIDRIDHDGAGRLRVIDYKSGASAISKTDVMEGRSMQVALYALAAERLFPDYSVAESYYLHLPSRSRGAHLKFEGPVSEHEAVRAALDRVAEAVRATRAGYFPNAPKKVHADRACAAWCELASICRVSRARLTKARGE